MGQTGVGKTSLLKELFGPALGKQFNGNGNTINHVHPGTKIPELYTIENNKGAKLIINDLPGIGESKDIDKQHIDTYLQFFPSSDIILWTMQADNRSTSFDVQNLTTLLDHFDLSSRKDLMSKIVFVLTKVDTLLSAPWFMNYYSPDQVKFTASEEMRRLIRQKKAFFQEQIIQPFGQLIHSRTHNDVSFTLKPPYLTNPPFSVDETKVIYQGLLVQKEVEEFSQNFPEYKGVFERLYDNYFPVPCSAHFKYNLNELVLVILNKLELGSDAAQNFKHAVDPHDLLYMPLHEARQRCNLLIHDVSNSRRIFDLMEGIFPDPKRDSVFYRKSIMNDKSIFQFLSQFFGRN